MLGHKCVASVANEYSNSDHEKNQECDANNISFRKVNSNIGLESCDSIYENSVLEKQRKKKMNTE